jgi:hypothetical protein
MNLGKPGRQFANSRKLIKKITINKKRKKKKKKHKKEKKPNYRDLLTNLFNILGL